MRCAGTYDLAGSRVRFEVDDPALAACLEGRFGAFAVDAQADWQVAVDSRAPTPHWLTSPAEVQLEPVEVEAGDGGFALLGATFSACVDLRRQRATVTGPRALYPVDLLLRHLLPLMIPESVIVHAALLADAGRAWVCCEASGAGKSTIARLVDDLALCDELVALRPVVGGIEARALPFWNGRPGSGMVEALYLLSHGSEHRREVLAPATVLPLLSTQVLWPIAVPRALDRCLGHLARVVEELPLVALAFVPRPDVRHAILGGGP